MAGGHPLPERDARAAHGVTVPSLCAEGLCGSRLSDLLEGVPDHRDVVLDDAEKASNRMRTICCSRATTPRLKLDL